MMSLLNDWALERYARTANKVSNGQEEWGIIESSPTYPLMLTLTKTGGLTVEVGGNIVEYHSLIRNRQIQVEVREEVCLHFVCTGDEMRKWLIKFTGGTLLGKMNCTNCHQYIRSFLDPPARALPLFPYHPGPQTINPNGTAGSAVTSTPPAVVSTTNSVRTTGLGWTPSAPAVNTTNLIGFETAAVSSTPAVANTTNPYGFGAAVVSSAPPVVIKTKSVRQTGLDWTPNAPAVVDITNPIGLEAASVSSAATVANITNPISIEEAAVSSVPPDVITAMPIGLGAPVVSSAPDITISKPVMTTGLLWTPRAPSEPAVANNRNPIGLGAPAVSSAPPVTNTANPIDYGAATVSSALAGAHDTYTLRSSAMPSVSRPTLSYGTNTLGTSGYACESNIPHGQCNTITSELETADLAAPTSALSVNNSINALGISSMTAALNSPAVTSIAKPVATAGLSLASNTPTTESASIPHGNRFDWTSNAPAVANIPNHPGEFCFPWAFRAPAVASTMHPAGASGFNWNLNAPSFTSFNSHLGTAGLPCTLGAPCFPNTFNPALTPIAMPPATDAPEPSKKKQRKSRATGITKKGRPPKVPETSNASEENVFTTVSTGGCSNALTPPVYSGDVQPSTALNSTTSKNQPLGSNTTNMYGKVLPDNLSRSLDEIPDLEQMVRFVLQDPKLPDLVDAVHKVISNM